MTNIKPFGTAPNGESVFLIELSNGTMTCEVITFGATIRSLTVPDRNSVPVDVVLGYDTLEGYVSYGGYLGATVGRYANRIARGSFQLNGQTYTLAANDGRNHLHGGLHGFSHRVWHIANSDANSVTLHLSSTDGEEGYPGNLECAVQFILEDHTLGIHYQATCDADTVCNLTNHSYFNLSGHNSGPVLEQTMQIFSQNYTPSDPESIPYGTVEPVENTPMDFRTPTPIGAHIHEDFHQLKQAKGYDHNYVIDGTIGALHPVARVHSPASGISMRVESTLPGVHFYAGNFLTNRYIGKGGCIYGQHHGFCLETQFFPDSPNRHVFPSAVLKAGTEYRHSTCFRFLVNAE